jgi:asparagine synthase (glutamine-hydrolysing)
MGGFVLSVALETGAAPLSTAPAARWLIPDADGYESWADNELAFTRSRFRADRAEPADMAPTPGADLVCLFDARLDNLDILASQLASGPAREFGSREAFLSGYRRWGLACTEHLRGEFAFALWDRTQRLLLAAGDPFGLRPLRFCRGEGNVLVGSRARALAACLSQHPEWDRDVLTRYLDGDSSSFLTHTVYRGIQAVPPGHALIVSPDGTRIVRYFQPERFRAERYRRFEDYAERLYELLSAAVVRRCRAASPIAVGLSGGVDSSSVASLVRPSRPRRPLRTSCHWAASRQC